MNLTLAEKDIYEQFEPRKDSLYFKVGMRGLVSFHSSIYHLKMRMSDEQRSRLMTDDTFVQIAEDCYVNLTKITSIENDCLRFGDTPDSLSRVPVSKRKQQELRELLFDRRLKH
ncbi:MAG TPA: LytTR family transcriptional regulator DNA-binding domain-containing protein [Bacilli bacterium]